MTKKKEAVELVETTTVPDKEVLRAKLKKLIAEIDEKLVKLGDGLAAIPYKVNGMTFRLMDNEGNVVAIHTITDVVYLLKALCKMREVKASFLAEVERLDLTVTPTLVWTGVSVDSWIHDLEIRIKQLTNTKQIQDLKDSKAKLELFLSEEDRLIKTLGDVSGLLGIKQNLLG